MKKDGKYTPVNQVIIVLILLLTAVTVAIFVRHLVQDVVNEKKNISITSVGNQTVSLNDKGIVEEKGGTIEEEEERNIKLVPNNDMERTFENIKTGIFEIVDTKSGNVLKLTDTSISFKDIEKTIDEYLSTSKYKTLAVGLLDNKFYIQQDTSIVEDKQLKAKIVTIIDKVTADSWFKLTEAVYNSYDVEVDSLFTYKTDAGNKHFIYIYKN